MKSKYIFPCLMALTVASGCVKEQGDEAYTITRTISDGSKDTARTVISEVNGYMYGKAIKDSVVENTYKVTGSSLDSYITFKSRYFDLDLDRNAIKSVGYVYSRNNSKPVLDGSDCVICDSRYVKYQAGDSTKTDITFTGTCHNLEFNSNYYVRSYAISTKGDTLYNPIITQLTTLLPHDVWFERNKASFSNRANCFYCTVGNSTYIYGGQNGSSYFSDMWVYNKEDSEDSDTWQQLATPTQTDNEVPRSNGAMFAYNNKLLYIIGGEISDGVYTDKVSFYSIGSNKYNQREEHPNYNTMVPYIENGKKVYEYTANDQPYEVELTDDKGNVVLDEDGNPIIITKHTDSTVMMVHASRNYIEPLPIPMAGMIAFSVTANGVKRYYVGLGKGKSPKQSQAGVINNIYEYDIQYDMTNFEKTELSTLTWNDQGSLAYRGNNIGLYQAVAEVCGSQLIIGTGETSDGVTNAFYTLTFGETGSITAKPLPEPVNSENLNEVLTPRANAASFYLNYNEDGIEYSRFYIGTGRTGKESGTYELLNDFWCYDFGTSKWSVLRECGTIYREGAIGFSVERNDDPLTAKGAVNIRGMFSLGYGYNLGQENGNYLRDNWEYLP